MCRVLAVCVSLLLLATLAACDEEDNDRGPATEQEPQATQQRAAPGQEDVETIAIEIHEDRAEPRQLSLTASQAVQLEITNHSSQDCSFLLGDYARGVVVPAGATVKNSVTLPARTVRQPNTATMGCEGDAERQTTVEIEFKGLAPQPGR